MADQSRIEWTDSTFNPWIGCTKVGPGCDHCYAEREMDHRRGRARWGSGQPRSRTSADYWRQPLRWDRQAEAFFAEHGRRRRVFCASLADVFDNEVDPAWRRDLFDLIRATPNLDWLLLTKRIGLAQRLFDECHDYLTDALDGPFIWPTNIWVGATVVTQEEVDRDVPKLLRIPASVRFLSIEPMLGRIDLCEQFGIWWNSTMSCFEGTGREINRRAYDGRPGIHWVIAGGESGPSARPMHVDWLRSLRDQCAGAGVPFLFKQWGEWAGASVERADKRGRYAIGSPDGFVLTDHYPRAFNRFGCVVVEWVGKKAAGRHLDGVLHDGFPA